MKTVSSPSFMLLLLFTVAYFPSCMSMQLRTPDGNGAVRPTPIKTPEPSDDEVKVMWGRFRKDHSVEDDSRFDAFKDNVRRAHNRNNEHGVNCTDFFDGPECIFGVTKFAHMTAEEFATAKLGRRLNRSQIAPQAPVMATKAMTSRTAVDWRHDGAVTSVKDQYMCGSCWAMSATEEIESAYFMATGKLEELSTEQIVDCDTTSWGCEGGLPENAIDYVMRAGGLDNALDYPDHSSATGITGSCKVRGAASATPAVQVASWQYAVEPCLQGACNTQDEDALATVLAESGPISICVHAEDWQLYMGGIYTAGCTCAADYLDHAVQLVGYNKDAPLPYWIIRNSWNTDWGMQGYIYLAMGSNLCGVADEAISVQVVA